MRVVVDTNVLLSGLISPGSPPAEIVDLWAEGVVEVAVSSPIISEYIGVLLRPRFEMIGSTAVRRETIQRLIDLQNTVVVVPGARVSCVSEDPSDNRFLECAKEAHADFIVSGDEHLLAIETYSGIRILTPRQFLEMLRQRDA